MENTRFTAICNQEHMLATPPVISRTPRPILTSTDQMALDGAEAVSVRFDSDREAGRGPAAVEDPLGNPGTPKATLNTHHC